MKILLTAATTVLGGVLVFAISQVLQKLLIEPVVEQRKVIGDVDFRLTFWAWAYANPRPQEEKTPERDNARDELRGGAARLLAATNAIQWWGLARRIGAVEPHCVDEAANS